MPELEKANVKASPHTWASPLRSFYTAHIAAGLGNVVIVEGVPGTMESVDFSPYKIRDGNIVTPATPGFGLPLPA
jgi:L-alanine-DL-glutamate epimerase-like enolase superfamily enzyme